MYIIGKASKEEVFIVMKAFLKKHMKMRWLLLAYVPLHFFVYFFLNQIEVGSYHAMHCVVDNYIPFSEWFVLPYLLWYIYVVWGVAVMFKQERKFFVPFAIYFFGGMASALILFAVYPTGVYFRPQASDLTGNPFLVWCVRLIYEADFPVNVCPSLHCYNSIAVTAGLWNVEYVKKHPWCRGAFVLLSVAICYSTMAIKQHSFVDFVAAVVMFIVLFTLGNLICRGRFSQETSQCRYPSAGARKYPSPER